MKNRDNAGEENGTPLTLSKAYRRTSKYNPIPTEQYNIKRHLSSAQVALILTDRGIDEFVFLAEQEAMLKKSKRKAETVLFANIASKIANIGGASSNQGNRQVSGGGKVGGNRTDRNEPNSARLSGRQPKPNTLCYRCFLYGHFSW